MQPKRILLIVGGGISAYKIPQLIRLMRAEGLSVTPVLTQAGAQFTTPMTLSVLAGEPVHDALWDIGTEAEIGHIQLSRNADLVVVAPATADMMAKMAQGIANDLATTLLLATDKRVLIAPAMNVRMWDHPATQRNRRTLAGDGILTVGPDSGDMACGEYGPGRMAEPEAIVAAIRDALAPRPQPLAGRHIVVTSGPTHEPIDPVRYIANRSSGAQGTAIAAALRDLGAKVSFVTGPATVPPPAGVEVVRVETARQMRDAVQAALPADAAVMAAAVADWHVTNASGLKMKKDGSGNPPALHMAENPDILRWLSNDAARPRLVVGFAAETHDVIAHATAKRQRKGCDWIVANDVSPATGIMGGTENAVTLITDTGVEDWPRMDKDRVAARLAARIAEALE
ncbi:bifunctional phosphopantothenoylcysteine decarboxylase/phosphopantothenate--cysteine ligase CoaBC [Paracoccus sp. 1_MG-2023]|uniref:bifunctional phosphopantothenoylcysteine decarboxylase/phosphopantothenate--cysteine ligase CoaBC n=1 Tax=unclassified Paracoccus (in: a-proteobacteria) TaxID=2688777 RepID=UPI001C0A5EE9|nr:MULTISPECIES: bifunctional phosphopantothenoylcysteine decarboxylase/phosphopantothenate--cysteine ligase CoaBC [unclassified Paracoccus (in: a-proteobacteria)]MBU2956775.1 bifunctional phosphopantothenoylcysteine decarboxylase/phosphopantothenate--cysteine ligase CoaBC [Paracoccus sp. C2R09]MDO6669186.1 bifunctional phosphopantothenoylcysteine decarboxylase/phosphopantothenate--cysteine ligase CoaBC [Paracoccus sp. 1_MG-2023]